MNIRNCANCANWDKTRSVTYDTGEVAICFTLSGRHLPSNKNTSLYSTHYRGSNGPNQNIVTREDFYCNKYSVIK